MFVFQLLKFGNFAWRISIVASFENQWNRKGNANGNVCETTWNRAVQFREIACQGDWSRGPSSWKRTSWRHEGARIFSSPSPTLSLWKGNATFLPRKKEMRSQFYDSLSDAIWAVYSYPAMHLPLICHSFEFRAFLGLLRI